MPQLASNESSDLHGVDQVVGIVPRDGFETSLALEYPARFARAAALDAEWNVLGSSGIVDVEKERVFGDPRPVTDVKHFGSIVIADDDAYGEEYLSISVTHSLFPGEAKVLGVSIGWHTALGCFLILGLWIAVRRF